jgi:hypothetical protein
MKLLAMGTIDSNSRHGITTEMETNSVSWMGLVVMAGRTGMIGKCSVLILTCRDLLQVH